MTIAPLGLLALAACVPGGGSGPVAETPRAESIAYETGRCFGACPVYRVTVDNQGHGTFEGIRFTAAEGTRSFEVTTAQYRAFARQLAPLRPANGAVRYDGPPLCKRMATDLPSVSVTWQDSAAPARSLYFYYGCDMETHKAMAERLRAAPAQLPIAEFIRSSP
jgi:hypothetical protein